MSSAFGQHGARPLPSHLLVRQRLSQGMCQLLEVLRITVSLSFRFWPFFTLVAATSCSWPVKGRWWISVSLLFCTSVYVFQFCFHIKSAAYQHTQNDVVGRVKCVRPVWCATASLIVDRASSGALWWQQCSSHSRPIKIRCWWISGFSLMLRVFTCCFHLGIEPSGASSGHFGRAHALPATFTSVAASHSWPVKEVMVDLASYSCLTLLCAPFSCCFPPGTSSRW